MKYHPLTLAICFLSTTSLLAQTTVIDFEDIELATESAAVADAGQSPIVTHGVSLNRKWDTTFNCCPSAWAVSNITDITTIGFSNPYAAYVTPSGGGVDGSNHYAVNNNFIEGWGTIQLPAAATVDGLYVTNTTWDFFSIRDGNDGNPTPFVRPFGNGDWFRLDIIGIDATGSETGRTEFFLADYRNGLTDVVSQWTWVDLAGLGSDVRSLEFALSSTDVDPLFGMNTPAYFAIDNLTFSTVPEPSTVAWGVVFAGLGTLVLRRRA